LDGASICILQCADGSYYERIVDAIAAERRIKGWSRAKKEAYIRGDFPALAVLAKRGPKGSD
jgi:putative endonuclease